jgi:hypothetical protein
MSCLPCNLFLQNFKTLTFLYDSIFHQVQPMNMYFHRKRHVFVVQKVWNQLYDFMHLFWFFFKLQFRQSIQLIYRTQNDIYIVRWKPFKVYHIGQKRPNPYYNPSLSYILIPMKNNESKVVKIFKKTIFKTIKILNFIIIIHKLCLYMVKKTR